MNRIIAIGGLPLSGKTMLGRALEARLDMFYADIDDGAARCTLPMVNDPYSTEEKARAERERIDIAYAILHETVRAHLRVGRSLIVSAVYREASRRAKLLDAVGYGVPFEFLLCRINNDSREEIARRIEGRRLWGAIGGCRSVEQYYKLPRWVDPDFPHRVVDTAHGQEHAVEQALRYLQAE